MQKIVLFFNQPFLFHEMLPNTKTKLVLFLPKMDKNLVEAVNGREVTNNKEFVYGKRPTNGRLGKWRRLKAAD
jgi:hypothetical protein